MLTKTKENKAVAAIVHTSTSTTRQDSSVIVIQIDTIERIENKK